MSPELHARILGLWLDSGRPLVRGAAVAGLVKRMKQSQSEVIEALIREEYGKAN